jgi:hypothetical protein
MGLRDRKESEALVGGEHTTDIKRAEHTRMIAIKAFGEHTLK